MRIGAHMSVAGGVSKAVERAVAHGCEALQIFCKNANQWRGRPLDRAEVRAFRAGVDRAGLSPAVSHASYLINLATSFPELRKQSLDAFVDELDRADMLGLLGVVIHPGACTAGDEDQALRLAAEMIRSAFEVRPRQRAMVLLEHTAGQGRTIGCRFEQLAAILEHLDGSPRVGVCLDTCHVLASGYDIASRGGYAETFAAFERTVGLDRLKVFHANDSKTPCGSRVDRHEHIGKGYLGLAPFRRLLGDRRFAGLAMIIETEKAGGPDRAGTIAVDRYDRANLGTLRRLRAVAARRPSSASRART
jgi:deoxyribonuclease-4